MLYIVRHGQTDYNVKELVCGSSNAKLTKRGIEQAQVLGKEIANQQFTCLYVSPLQRAIDTAKYLDIKHVEMIIEPRIREISFGIFEGTTHLQQEFLDNKYNLAYRYPGGESFVELCQRVYEFLDEIKYEAIVGNVLLVCHGVVCRAVHTYFNDMTNDEIFHYQIENCTLLGYDYLSK